jgi:predicted kinase
MRKLIVMRGPPASGKSTFIEKMGLTHYALSLDALRKVLASPVVNSSGMQVLSAENEKRANSLFMEILEERMARGETLVLDTTGPVFKDDTLFIKAAEYGYDVACVDMSGVSNNVVQRRNRARPDYERVPEKAMARMFERFAAPWTAPPGVTHIKVETDSLAAQTALTAWLTTPVHDLSAFEKVVFIGDLQGCLTPLTGPGGILQDGFASGTAYIFVGDLLDRGPENGLVMRWFLDEALNRPNVFLIHGNHEDHILRWSKGQPSVSAEFQDRTLPQLLAVGCTPKDGALICQKALPFMQVHWRSHKILVTHAGFPTVPRDLWGVSAAQLGRGTGRWSDPVDEQFERNAPPGWEQVHGHRNHGSLPVQATARSFNLEDQVERGGALRAVELSASGWTPKVVQNTAFIPWRQQRHKAKSWHPSWMNEPNVAALPPSLIQDMRNHAGVNESQSKSYPHVNSFGFTRKVFNDRSWDDVVVKARGLFFDNQSGAVVARGYEKFFNIDERPETSVDSLAKSFSWPVHGYIKENGFLGNLGYDAKTQQLFFASKSTPDSDFAKWFREIFDLTVPAPRQESLRRFLRDFECSMVFEVIDPVRDPHLIDYPAPKIVLLDVFHRAPDARKLPYDELQKVAEEFGLPVKSIALVLQNEEAFKGWHTKISGDLEFRLSGRDVEGLVLEDKAGFQTKLKFARYAFWKEMRSAVDYIARLRAKVAAAPNNQQVLANAKGAEASALTRSSHPLAKAFLAWVISLPDDMIENHILALRKQFYGNVPQDESWSKYKWFFEERSPPEKSSANSNSPG